LLTRAAAGGWQDGWLAPEDPGVSQVIQVLLVVVRGQHLGGVAGRVRQRVLA
jgi:hypothetical protein